MLWRGEARKLFEFAPRRVFSPFVGQNGKLPNKDARAAPETEGNKRKRMRGMQPERWPQGSRLISYVGEINGQRPLFPQEFLFRLSVLV